MRVIVESPFAGGFANVKYAREAVRDCIDRGESPFASHLLYTQKGLLDDRVAEERRKGIDAALGWLQVADYVAVYMDLGVTPGMVVGIVRAVRMGKPIRLRWLRIERKEQAIDENEEIPHHLRRDGSRGRDHLRERELGINTGTDELRSVTETIARSLNHLKSGA